MKHLRFPLLLLGLLTALNAYGQTVVANNTTYSSTATVSGPATIETNSNTVTVSSGANVTFQATTSIHLGPGFTAANGSSFHALLTLPPTITSSSSASGVVGSAFSFTVTADNYSTSFNALGLPGNLSVNTSSGVISGTPTVVGTFNVTLRAINAYGVGTQSLLLTISIGGGTDTDGDGINDQTETALGTNSATTTTANPAIDLKVHRPN